MWFHSTECSDLTRDQHKRRITCMSVWKEVDKLIQRGYVDILRGSGVKNKQYPKVRKGEKINAEKYAQTICCFIEMLHLCSHCSS